jgi:hypothetical protein
MTKQQAILETLLGTAELKGNQAIASSIRIALFKKGNSQRVDGCQRLAQAISEIKRPRSNAA